MNKNPVDYSQTGTIFSLFVAPSISYHIVLVGLANCLEMWLLHSTHYCMYLTHICCSYRPYHEHAPLYGQPATFSISCESVNFVPYLALFRWYFGTGQVTGHYLTKFYGITRPEWVNTLRPRQNGCHFPDDILKWIFLNENIWISIKISLKLVPRGSINNIPALVQIMAWRRPGDKPLSEPWWLGCWRIYARPQWVKVLNLSSLSSPVM